MKTKKQILKQAMSKEYCGETRYDFLDKEEIVMILKAMEEYATQQLQLGGVVVSEAELKCMMTDDEPNCDCPINHCKKQGW